MDEWSKFLMHCLETRLSPDKFDKFATILHSKRPLPPNGIADVLLRPPLYQPVGGSRSSLDPKIPEYVQRLLLHNGILDLPSVLRSVLRYSNLRPPSTSGADAKAAADYASRSNDEVERVRWRDSLRWGKANYVQEEALMYGLVKVVSSGARPQNVQEVVSLIRALTEWMKVLVAAGVADDMMQQMGGAAETHTAETLAVMIAVGTLLVATSENMKAVRILEKICPREILKSFSQTLASFTPRLLGGSPIIAERLDLFRTQTLIPLEPVDKKVQAADDELDQYIDSTIGLALDAIPVVDPPVVNSRAGLYIYIQSLLVGRPLTDNDAIFNYLHNRYQVDIQTTCIDLIISSFDVLANALFRNENAQNTLLLRSFLINKVPLLLAALFSSTFRPISPEFCITEALSQVDTNAFPTLSSMFDEASTGNIFSDSVRQDFCFACCLHGLIPEESIERLLGEIPMQTLSTDGRYTKEGLVQECSADPERVEGLLDQLENMDGNVGAVSQAITEIIRQYCAMNETMSLKTLCNQLARKPSSLDIMLLFDKPTTILQPICELLDRWQYDDDQGEYQPVYEEFGSILLLLLAFVHRYNLSTLDLGVQSHDSFVGKLLVRGAISRPLDELSEQEKNYLDGWIRGLFNSEFNAGLGDEPMSQCPPQAFYLLVPTLFHQIVIATSTGYLTDETLKGGLEYLVETFLLPCLVGAIMWLANHLWESKDDSKDDSNAVVQILQTLIAPSSISGEAYQMLNSVLNIIAKPLEHSLRPLQRTEQTRQDVEPLSRALKSHLSFSRSAGSDHTELEAWSGVQPSGFSASLRQSFSLLVSWPLAQGINAMPPSYTHRQLLTTVRLIGAKRTLHVLLEEIKVQSASGSASVAIDVATAMICAPDISAAPAALDHSSLLPLDEAPPAVPLQMRLSLRAALRTEAEGAPKLHKTDAELAEAIIRLYRRVEAMMAEPVRILDPGVAAGGALGPPGLDLGVGVGVLHNAQDIEDAIAAAADQDVMNAMAMGGDGMIVGHDDLMGDINFG